MTHPKTLQVNGHSYGIYALPKDERLSRLPFCLKVLLENLIRFKDEKIVNQSDIDWFLHWDKNDYQEKEIAFHPARVLMQDFTGVPALADLASMRDAVKELGASPNIVNPLQPAELVIDHSVQVDNHGDKNALDLNIKLEYYRNKERYQFLKWGQKAFSNFRVVPPGTGIVHQVNIEYLSRCVFLSPEGLLYPDTVVGTDSHTTMVNALGVLGWGVGGIEAEAAMLGQPISMLVPKVTGVRLHGALREGTTATDLVLRIVEMLRKHGVVGKFVEFCGEGLKNLSLADRATIANMAPEYGATCGIFPVDQETLNYLKLSNRTDQQIALTEAYYREQGMFYDHQNTNPEYNETLELDLTSITPSVAGPKRPQDRLSLDEIKPSFVQSHPKITSTQLTIDGQTTELRDGAVVIAAITSCTNTSNPAVILGAGLVAKKACALGLKTQPWVKASLAPGSKVATRYLEKAGLIEFLEALNFHNVGYGCTTCIGNSGPLPTDIAEAVDQNDLSVCAVLSGNRNFEGRIHPQVKMNYLASPLLVVAYAIAGRIDIDLLTDPISNDSNGNPVYLKDIWPTQQEVRQMVDQYVDKKHFQETYQDVFSGDENWLKLASSDSMQYPWSESSYIRKPPFLDHIANPEPEVNTIENAQVLAFLGDSVTTDHISPAGSIQLDSPAGQYLTEIGVESSEFNSYGSRRGNHEVMARGTFANIRLRNKLLSETEGGFTLYLPNQKQMSIYEAATLYRQTNTPIIIIAGKEYGTGSSRDWAAKGCKLLGVQAVLAESFERIHRSNLVGMGILPLQFKPGDSPASLGLTGFETYHIRNINSGAAEQVEVTAIHKGQSIVFHMIVRIDTPQETAYYQNDGILRYVVRQLVAKN